MDYQGTIQEVMTALNDLLKALRSEKAGSQLSRVSTFQLGILPVTIVYPAIALLPDSEMYTRFESGGHYTVERNFQIEGFIKELDITSAQQRATTLGEEIRDGLLRRASIRKSDKEKSLVGFGMTVGNLTLAEGVSNEDFVIGKFILPITVFSHSVIPSTKKVEQTHTERPEKEVFSKLLEILKANRSLMFSVVRPSNIFSVVLPGLGTFNTPAVFVEEISSDLLRRESGRDTIIRNFVISVYTSAIPKPQLLWSNLEVLEGIRDTILVNSQLDGLAKRTVVDKSSFYISTLKGSNSYFYRSSLDVKVECFRGVDFV
ncbi:hypothetical protein C4561_01570 [candidate division WWE3 bacterium]|uniref:Uncharacterized protein n=1 Tax=candidate division WWE3 bacterium TaxID=2053526 RepID=A0A3A4ZFE8_UNCKA|nr:MAG: hypothetical protein C4561_01570 [candidate division WWE3 bacterium]